MWCWKDVSLPCTRHLFNFTLTNMKIVLLQDYAGKLERPVDPDGRENIPVLARAGGETLHRTHVMCEEKRTGKERNANNLPIITAFLFMETSCQPFGYHQYKFTIAHFSQMYFQTFFNWVTTHDVKVICTFLTCFLFIFLDHCVQNDGGKPRYRLGNTHCTPQR